MCIRDSLQSTHTQAKDLFGAHVQAGALQHMPAGWITTDRQDSPHLSRSLLHQAPGITPDGIGAETWVRTLTRCSMMQPRPARCEPSAERHDSFASGSLMVCAAFLLIGIVDNDKKVKNQPDERNNNRFNHDPLPCCLDASFLAASSMTIRM